MRNALITVAATFLVVLALSSAGVDAQQPRATTLQVTGDDELVAEKTRQFDELWLRPDADMSRYDSLYLWQPVFEFREVSNESVNKTTIALSRGDQGPYEIEPEDRETFARIVSEVVARELARSERFELVDAIGPATLIVRGLVLDITSNVPPNVGRRGNVYLSAMGEATFVFELIDASSGVIQARAFERRLIQPRSRMNEVSRAPATRATVWQDVEIWAAEQARTLRKRLDKAVEQQ